jgi:hypothetical protein
MERQGLGFRMAHPHTGWKSALDGYLAACCYLCPRSTRCLSSHLEYLRNSHSELPRSCVSNTAGARRVWCRRLDSLLLRRDSVDLGERQSEL